MTLLTFISIYLLLGFLFSYLFFWCAAFTNRVKTKSILKRFYRDVRKKGDIARIVAIAMPLGWVLFVVLFFYKGGKEEDSLFQTLRENFKEAKVKRNIAMERLKEVKAIRKYKEENPTFEDIIAKLNKEVTNN